LTSKFGEFVRLVSARIPLMEFVDIASEGFAIPKTYPFVPLL